MNRNKLYILISVSTIIMFFGTAVSCNFCGIPVKVGETEEDKAEISIKDTEKTLI